MMKFYEKITDLSFSMLNRYPADVFVNSIQGKYLVLSAGKEQMLKRGDTLEFYDIDIEKVNPANGTWVSYKETNSGTAKIIDSKNYTAIAEISSQISANAIKVDSAARIKDIPTREKFAYSDVETEYTDDEPEVIEVTPKYVEDDKELKAVTKPEEEVKPEKTVEKVAEKAEPKEEEPKLIEKNELQQVQRKNLRLKQRLLKPLHLRKRK